MAIIKISEENGGIWAEEATPDPKAIYIGDEMRAELEDIEKQLVEVEKEPDEILVLNDSKHHSLYVLNSRKEEINKILYG